MDFKKNVISFICAATLTAATYSLPKTILTTPTNVTNDIHKMIKKLDLDIKNIDKATLKIKFMVNEDNELIVISTGDSKLDATIKGALNYKEVNTTGLKPYSVYIVPVTFELK